jgi:nucleoside-diphosphate-sugar epimerase
MRIAITGASGFVGRYVLRELQARGLDIVVVARSADRFPAQSGVHEFAVIDIANCGDNPFGAMGAPDILIHLAWSGLPNYQSPHHVETELPAQTTFLASCVEAGLKRLVVAGTCFEYGLASGELTEDTQTRPCTQYGTAKDMLRKVLDALSHEHDFEFAWLRLFYLFGNGQSSQSLYSLFHEAIHRGDQTFDMSGGEQVRDFLPINEAARLIVEVALLQGNIGVVNICSGMPMTVRTLVQKWIDESGTRITMNLGRLPYPDTEPMAFWGNRGKLNALLGGS